MKMLTYFFGVFNRDRDVKFVLLLFFFFFFFIQLKERFFKKLKENLLELQAVKYFLPSRTRVYFGNQNSSQILKLY